MVLLRATAEKSWQSTFWGRTAHIFHCDVVPFKKKNSGGGSNSGQSGAISVYASLHFNSPLPPIGGKTSLLEVLCGRKNLKLLSLGPNGACTMSMHVSREVGLFSREVERTLQCQIEHFNVNDQKSDEHSVTT